MAANAESPDDSQLAPAATLNEVAAPGCPREAESYTGISAEQRKWEYRLKAKARATEDINRPLAAYVLVIAEDGRDVFGPLPAIEQALHHAKRLPEGWYAIVAADGRHLASVQPPMTTVDFPRCARIAAKWLSLLNARPSGGE